MNIVQTGVVGGLATFAAFGISRASGGFVEGASFLLFLFIATLTVGALVAIGFDSWTDSRQAARLAIVAGPRRRMFRMACSSCKGRMERVADIWLCDACDRTPAHH